MYRPVTRITCFNHDSSFFRCTDDGACRGASHIRIFSLRIQELSREILRRKWRRSRDCEARLSTQVSSLLRCQGIPKSSNLVYEEEACSFPRLWYPLMRDECIQSKIAVSRRDGSSLQWTLERDSRSDCCRHDLQSHCSTRTSEFSKLFAS